MFKKFKWLKYSVITILIGMVFAVNVGWTWATMDYDLKVGTGSTSQAEDDMSWSYLNDVVVNNSTIEIPIPYSLGTVSREISFDYSFTENMDIAVVYSLSYTDGTKVTNVSLNIADRDDYILDVPTVISETGVMQYNPQSDRGTMYYLKTLYGSGNKVLFNGVTFYGGNNQVSKYKAQNAINLYRSSYTAGDKKTSTEFKYTSVDIARYWEVGAYSNGTNVVTIEEYKELSASEQLGYSISQYKCKQAYTIAGTTISKDTTASVSEYNSYINAGANRWTLQYVCDIACTIDGTSYVENQVISESTYEALTSGQGNFSKQYLCSSSYTVVGASAKTVAQNGVITEEEYSSLYYLEQLNFVPSEYVGFEGKKLKIDVSVYTKANIIETDEVASDYYNGEHYFVNFKQQLVSQAFNNWIISKSGSLSSHQLFSLGSTTSTTTINGVTYTNNGDGTITVNGTASGSYSRFNISSISYKEGHIYLLRGCPSGGASQTQYFLYIDIGGVGLNDKGGGAIRTCPKDYTHTGFIQVPVGVTCDNLVFKPEVYDLTEIFGQGNEPSTVEEFNQKYDNLGTSESGTKIMIYNAHGDFESGIPYAYDYSSNVDLSTETARADIRSSYVYNLDGTIHAYASGNKYDAGVGVYYMASEDGTLRCSFGANWYNPNGDLVATMPINNIEFGVNSKFNSLGTNSYGFSKILKAGSYGYIDLVDYIQTTTKADIVNLVGYRLVITSVTVDFVTDYSSWSTRPSGNYSAEDVKVNNQTSYNHVLYTYAGNMQIGSNLNVNLSITNDSDEAKTITGLTISPKFVAYNGLTSSEFDVANTKYLSFGDASSSGTRLIYNSSTWTKSSGSGNSYVFTTNGIYMAPHTSLNVISGIYVSAQTLNDWKITVGDTEYYADYWFSFEVVSLTYSTASTNKTTTTDAELISDLTTSTINAGESSYIALRNNTSQIMTNVTFSGRIVYKANPTNTIGYTLLNYATSSSSTLSQASTISISFTGVNLLPGESIILGKVTANSSSNGIGFSTYSTSCALGSVPSLTSTYMKRDFASGNLSVINAGTSKAELNLQLKNFASTVTLQDVSLLNGGANKWIYSNSNFKYIEKNSTNSAYIHAGQVLNLLSSYYLNDINVTFN